MFVTFGSGTPAFQDAQANAEEHPKTTKPENYRIISHVQPKRDPNPKNRRKQQ